MADKGTELAITKPLGITTLSDFTTIQSMGDAFFKSGMFSDVKSVAQAIVKITAGAELGLPPVYSMQNINMIRNRLTSSANTMAMLVKRSGGYNYRIKAHDEESCSIAFFEREGEKWVEVGVSTFTMADAKRAELVKPDSGWVKYPRAMLFSRAISQGARLYAPDAIGGIYTDEEIRSIPPKPDDTPEEADKDESPTTKPKEAIEGLWPKAESARETPGPPLHSESATVTPAATEKGDPIGDASRGKFSVAENSQRVLPDEPAPEPLESTRSPSKEQTGIIDLDWLKKSVSELQEGGMKGWTKPNILGYLYSFTRSPSMTITEAVGKLNDSQARQFKEQVEHALKELKDSKGTS